MSSVETKQKRVLCY